MLYKIIDSIMGFLGYVPRLSEKLLLQQVLILEEENLRIKDENASLWDMLDEMKKSDIAENQSAMRSFVEDLQDSLTDEMLKDFKPVGEA